MGNKQSYLIIPKISAIKHISQCIRGQYLAIFIIQYEYCTTGSSFKAYRHVLNM